MPVEKICGLSSLQALALQFILIHLSEVGFFVPQDFSIACYFYTRITWHKNEQYILKGDSSPRRHLSQLLWFCMQLHFNPFYRPLKLSKKDLWQIYGQLKRLFTHNATTTHFVYCFRFIVMCELDLDNSSGLESERMWFLNVAFPDWFLLVNALKQLKSNHTV